MPVADDNRPMSVKNGRALKQDIKNEMGGGLSATL